MRIQFTIPIVPQGQRRDRITTFGGHGRSYKDKAQAMYEGKVKALISQYRPERPFDCALELWVRISLPIPKAWSKKKKLAAMSGDIFPVVKPDFDNALKNIADIMNGIFFLDDKQITDAHISKRYSDNPRWEIVLETVKQETITNINLQ